MTTTIRMNEVRFGAVHNAFEVKFGRAPECSLFDTHDYETIKAVFDSVAEAETFTAVYYQVFHPETTVSRGDVVRRAWVSRRALYGKSGRK